MAIITTPRLIAATLLCAAASLAQTPASAGAPPSEMGMPGMNANSLPKNFNDPMPLYKSALGSFTYAISSKNPEAQAYFDQGFQLMYAYGKHDAARSFREAEKRDPDCAICYWGEAWAWGAYLNGAMEAFEAPYALKAEKKALELAPAHATPKERALIDAMSVRYVEHYDPKKRKDQDAPYAEAMRKVAERYPKDLDIVTLYADSLFLMEPRRGSRDIDSPNVQRILAVLEGVLKVDPWHVGSCHLYVHLTEATTAPEKAEECADVLGNLIPGASHLNHMPAHTFNQIGRWGDSVKSNIEAWHSDQKAAIGQGFAIYPDHNLHMLLFAASMDGQGAIAIQAAKDYFKLNGENMFQILTLVRFGRFDEIPEIAERPDDDIPAGVWDFGQGYAQLRAGEKDFAQAYLSRLQKAAETSKAQFRGHPAHDLLGTLAGILEGEIERKDGNPDKAIASFERAVERYDAIIYDEPEPFPFSPRHWLGAALIEAKRYPDAERIYREDLKRHPKNGWSLLGLKQALEGEGKPSPEVASQFAASWARSDTWIQASRF